MELEKIRNLSDDELGAPGEDAAEQLFRLRFQMALGQNDGVKKLRQLRKEIARIKTVARERELAFAAPKPNTPRGAGQEAAQEGEEGSRSMMAAGTATAGQAQTPASRRNEKVGLVVSTKMQKTIVVEIEMRKAHPKYKRVMKSSKKFYAHDEQNSARVGDVVRIRESASAEQAEALVAGRDRPPFVAGQLEDTATVEQVAEAAKPRDERAGAR